MSTQNKISENEMEMQYAKLFFRNAASDFLQIPGAPIAYFASKNARDAFALGTLAIDFICDGSLKTGCNETYIRFHWEINARDRSKNGPWRDHPKGGDFRKWSGNKDCVVRWTSTSISHYRQDKIARILDQKYWDLAGISWSAISSGMPSFRYLAENDISNNAALCIFPKCKSDLFKHLGYLNSNLCRFFLSIRTQTLNFLAGDVTSIPRNIDSSTQVAINSARCVDISQSDWDSFEVSWGFEQNPLVEKSALLKLAERSSATRISDICEFIKSETNEMALEMQLREEENNKILIELFGLEEEVDYKVTLDAISLSSNPHYRYRNIRGEVDIEELQLGDTMRELISYSLGCMFGRYSLNAPGLILANMGDTVYDYFRIETEKQSFLHNGSESNIERSIFSPDEDNVIPILEGNWFTDDMTERFKEFLKITFGTENYDENLKFLEDALYPDNPTAKKRKTIRDYFLKDFYEHHLKMYKKRPIYWLFSSPKGTFQALIYMHRYRPETVGKVLECLRDFRDKLAHHVEHRQMIADSANASKSEKTQAIKDVTNIKKQLKELEDYEKTLFEVAAKKIEIDLDDGVKHNYQLFGSVLRKIPGLAAKED